MARVVQVGVFFGSPETTSGGQALKFYASQRVDVRVREKIKGGATAAGAGQQSEGGSSQQGGEIGVRVRAKVVKNKVAPPYR
jgi:recombination protein RecA